MAQNYYTLEEAAQRLGITPEEMKRRLREEWKAIRPFRDGATLRFRATDIDDLARSMGEDSSPDLAIDPLMFDAPEPTVQADVAPSPFGFQNNESTTAASSIGSPASDDEPLDLGGDDDMFVMTPDDSRPIDSDVKLGTKSPSIGNAGGSDDAPFSLQLDDSNPDAPPVAGNSSVKLNADASADSSEFDLQLDGSSDFQLDVSSDADSEEVSLGDLPVSRSGNRGGESGINLGSPADSGISLEGKGPKTLGGAASRPADSNPDEDIDFELSLDTNASSTGRHKGPRSSMNLANEESSEFDLELPDLAPDSMMDDDPASSLEIDKPSGDIFETDFDIPAVEDSASESLELEEADTDLEGSSDLALDDDEAPLDESASEVVVVDEDLQAGRSSRRRRAADDDDELDYDDLDTSDSASKALAGARKNDDDEDEDEVAPAGVYRPTPWGPFTIAMLFFTVPVIFLCGLMSYELLHSMWGYQAGTRPSAMVIKALAGMVDMAPKE
ncbi:hypothetical protein [Tuwongella immobilis]|uniref:Uncharacterized protein n=1 Tax=Tuwongella immobilis TaxID=692036 RepID=A0A6C2YLT3_9BACT|nr:hypothetical protein [Tuwongella immobilis]VIP02334.1 Uncharacterized protein OS=Singulisphaera acidiphila (strain ATCC BAA-1392 / DSM 18658 / VKM B-2454 / MOB10) GN=Sinac_3196 PE=4 SV=1 [Tuwongella immobilis]VTS01088.1 Uncharacterized protein OS=Singulisphaera acidiphila (strain ATCC BAA-1392 / DSM 18658 / VKM B-2454 / MOB10) GN=Sinac_3196 PE=4 SV=1 [Tuwongella immobilis]